MRIAPNLIEAIVDIYSRDQRIEISQKEASRSLSHIEGRIAGI